MTFGEKLRELRDAAGVTQIDLATGAGIGLQTLRDYEADRRSPSFENALKLCAFLGATCREFEGVEFKHARRRGTGEGEEES